MSLSAPSYLHNALLFSLTVEQRFRKTRQSLQIQLNYLFQACFPSLAETKTLRISSHANMRHLIFAALTHISLSFGNEFFNNFGFPKEKQVYGSLAQSCSIPILFEY